MIRLAVPALTAFALVAGSATASDLTSLSDGERDAFRAEVRAYLMENPEIIIEAVNLLEERNAQAQAAADVDLVRDNADDLFEDGFSWIGGNPDGDITLVEFMDYRCGYCKRAHPEVAALIAGDNNIRYVIKEFPILGEQSEMASRYALAVKQLEGNESYKTVHDTLMEFQGDVTPASLARISAAFGLDNDAVLAAMQGPEVSNVIAQNRALAQQLQISGTPSFVFQNQMLRGYVPLQQMQQIVTEIRENAG